MIRLVQVLVFALVACFGTASGAHAFEAKTALRRNFELGADRVGALVLEARGTRRQTPSHGTGIASDSLHAARGAANVADDVGAVATKLCFPAGTPVLTPDGWVPIEDVEVGNEVYAFDQETGEIVVRRVEKTFENVTDVLVEIGYEGGRLSATMSHPFWVEGAGWVAAKELETGMRLRTPDGSVEILQVGTSIAERVVYNFSVEGEHNYFAGHVPVLVHNQDASFANYNAAIQDALGWLRGQGVDTSTLSEIRDSRIGNGRGLTVPGGRAGFRIEWDPRSGAHINAWAGKAKSPHFQFPGNEKSVQSLLRTLYCR